jgi:hypothetical protein
MRAGIFAIVVAACAHSSSGGGGGYAPAAPAAPAPPDPIVGTWRGDLSGLADADAQGNVYLHLSEEAPECATSAPDAVSACSHGSWTDTGNGVYTFTVRDFDVSNCTCGETLDYTGTLSGNTVTIGDGDDVFTRQ